MGVGAPGFIEPGTGKVAIAVNIGWKDFALKDILRDLSGLQVYVDNDANIAALGENWKGAGNQVNNMLAVTLGTGVGGGIIANGQVISGANGTGAEIGHITVEKNGASCNCGRKGCLETVASATGIVRQAEELLAEGKA
ncbi:glucokinase [Gracilibacillus boraciitolerans JCM 21714]|uniref:Glucokinase n=1 Tax=Gracilibacillus boraciitolerans JCM 21714 TaxID=1298598 RepID=W4VCR4_9BACI|nr:glucokinase [Gracilibacillus boraciitolerans JCM 21714]